MGISSSMGAVNSVYIVYILLSNCNGFRNMATHKVGEIQGYDVLYVPERNQIFCKNTAVNFSLIERIIRGSTIRESIPEKELTITKEGSVVTLGCLTTTMKNCLSIRQNVNKINK